MHATHDFSSFSLRHAVESDIAFLLDLRIQAMGPHHRAAGVVLSAQEHEQRMRDHFECAEVIEVEGAPVGMLKVLRAGLDWRIMQIQLLPPHQRRGIGGQLVRTVVAEAGSAGASLRLTVMKANPQARRLYERLGFTVVSESAGGFQMLARDDTLSNAP